MKTLQLREWATTYGLALSTAERDLLRGRFRARVQPTRGIDNRYDVTPTGIVGAAVVGDKAVVIRPKISITRIMFLLGYIASPDWHDADSAVLAETDDIVDAMAALYVRVAKRALRRGLLAGYRSADEELYTVRGRINLAEQLRRRPGQDLPLAIHWQEYDEDILENQLLLAATRLLQPLPFIQPSTRAELRRISETMQHVTAVRFPRHGVPRPTWTRLNTHYRPAVELAQLLLQHAGVDLEHGGTATPALTINMARVFEQFVRTALRHALQASDAEFPDGASRPVPFDLAPSVHLEPDLSYWPNGQCVFVGDVKYKRDAGTGHNSDLYQLLAYATALRLPQATLVYADGPASAPSIRVRESQVTIHVRHLDLSAPPAQLLVQVQSLTAAIRTAAASGETGRPVTSGWSGGIGRCPVGTE